MLILSIRTDKPEAELGLFEDGTKTKYEAWQAHRLLAETIHQKIRDLLRSASKELNDVEGILVFQGPGSFTGLRIGVSVANALASSLAVPVVGQAGDDWLEKGMAKIVQGKSDKIVLPEYGSPPHVTTPKH